MAPKRTLSTPLSLDDAQKQVDNLSKAQDLSANTTESGAMLTDNMGHPVSDDQNSLRVGDRGPTLMEDFLAREKIFHFDHERIPERIVHARGSAAHGTFEVTKALTMRKVWMPKPSMNRRLRGMARSDMAHMTLCSVSGISETKSQKVSWAEAACG